MAAFVEAVVGDELELGGVFHSDSMRDFALEECGVLAQRLEHRLFVLPEQRLHEHGGVTQIGQDEEAVLKALRQNTAYVQREVAHRVRTKYAAKLKFVADESFDESSHIEKLLRSEKVAQDLEPE